MLRDTSPLLTVREVAHRLRISLATAYVLIKQGDLACCRIGGKRGAIRVREADVHSYLNGCEDTLDQADILTVASASQFKHLKLN